MAYDPARLGKPRELLAGVPKRSPRDAGKTVSAHGFLIGQFLLRNWKDGGGLCCCDSMRCRTTGEAHVIAPCFIERAVLKNGLVGPAIGCSTEHQAGGASSLPNVPKASGNTLPMPMRLMAVVDP